jgi:hypothetical protein
MITANEALTITEEVIKDNQKVIKILDFIDNEIRESAHKGNTSIYIDNSQLSNLSHIQEEQLFNKIRANGFKITSVYDIMEHGVKGYNIIWKNN